ncbi:connectin-like [Anopheles aquasalis]|uniref:connectin-like n=1 Tax=Anopheles aquasalis TaxID=42839 RepID=UPI00215B6A6A|nr:connectin-like [Anopheles aquasalis]XP_050085239.1 connectin-like [Anopheles aquasalis]
MASTMTTYRHLSLVALLVLCLVTSPTESRYREKDAKKGKGATASQQQQQHHNMPPMVIPSPLMNLCSGDREMKLVCHCSPDDPHVKAQKANCWIFSKELPRKDANWLAFQTQSTLEQLKITVQKIGNLAYIPSDVLHTLKYLRQLTIEYGVIPDLQNYAFGNLTELRNVTLHKNQIRLVHPFAFANHPHLEEINLERNEILELDKEALVHLPALRKLNLDFNNLTMLHDDVFVFLTGLDELKLESNQISVLTREIFKGLGNLRILKLTANSLSFIGDTIFAELWSLQELDLDHNQIEKLSARAFDGLNNLRKLNLENNRLKRLERGIFTGVPAVLNLNLNSNQLETITYNNFLPLMDNLVNSTAILHLKDNRFICDCRLLWLFDLRNSTKNDVLRQALQQIECLHDFKGTSLIYGGPVPPPAPPNQLLPNHLKDYGRGPPHELIIDNDYYDETGGHHRPPKPSVTIQKKFSSSRSAGDGGSVAAAAGAGDKATEAVLQTVKLMSLRKDTILPCPKELDEPTELPLSRESIGLDMGWRSSVTATSAAARSDRFPGGMMLLGLIFGSVLPQFTSYVRSLAVC